MIKSSIAAQFGERTTRPGVVLVASIILPALLFIFLVRHDAAARREALEAHGAIATMLAREQTQRLLDAGILALDWAEDIIDGSDMAQVVANPMAAQADLQRIAQRLGPTLYNVALICPDGTVPAFAGPEPATREDIRHAMQLAAGGGATLRFEPASGNTGDILLFRGRDTDRGPADGTLLARLRGQAFLDAWRKASNHADARFALLRDDRTVLLRESAGAGMPPAIEADDPILRAIADPQGSVEPRDGDPFRDGRPQIVVWRPVGTLPLRVVFTVPADAEMRASLYSVVVSGLVCGTAGLLLALIAFAGRRRMLHDRQTLARLEANATELREEIVRREIAEEGLRAAQRLEGLGRLTGGVAHDFNNLLTAILGTARALERHLGEAADDRSRRLLAALVAAVDRGARLNASLLAFARRQPLVLSAIDANTLAREFQPLLRRALDESVGLELSLDHRLPLCHADAAQLEVTLLNLVINSGDAMPGGGTVRIVTRRAWLQEQALAGNPEAKPGPYVAIEVRDTGEGMSAEVRERAFEPFFTTKREGHGTGLGLSQVFGFMRQIGGHVTIQSALRRGTTVTLYLPLASESTSVAQRGGPDTSAPISGDGVTVLVVEDEPTVRAVAVEMLTHAGFSVLSAWDGPTALKLLEEGMAVDILFSDVVLPGGMSGVGLAQEARKLRPGIGVLLVSGYAAEALDKHGGAGGFELVGKPYDIRTVLHRISDLARQRRGGDATAVGAAPALTPRR